MSDYLIRPGRIADTADVAALQAAVQLQAATGGQPHPGIAAWVEDLMEGHPSVTPADFLVAEDTATGRPVASLVSLRQDWFLDGVRLPAVQTELVGTAPEHRGNRLTERLFAALHERYPTADVPIQMIEGIPYFYRRFGYEYAMANDGAPTVPASALPTTGPATAPPQTGPLPTRPATTPPQTGSLTMRSATAADAEDLAAIDKEIADGPALVCPRDAAVWRYEIAGRRPEDILRRSVALLLDGTDVRGYVVHGSRLSTGGLLTVFAAACPDPADWPHAATTMYAHLNHTGHGFEAGQPFTAVRLLLGPEHPLAQFGPPGIAARPSGWYIRHTDPADLLTRLQPLLRKRWHGLRWPEPDLTINTYGRAARLSFTDGELSTVTAVRSPAGPDDHAHIPPGALLQLALGHRTIPEVLDTWPDCVLRDRLTEHFLTAAFPRVPIRIWSRG
ncbi:GNAT family N-acetyltransferase [Actinoplanes sp. NBC_00393]|uniref:GNAT family N-acetyltransferase n=1 Tax=Actinoplanes sp. NBC_00393 TaxID=2975953 RepID=UPI002E2457A7